MQLALKEMRDWLYFYNSNKLYIFLCACACVYICVTNEKLRKQLIIPILFTVILLLNPLLYIYVYRKMIYWRFFWMLSDALLLAYVMTDIVKRVKGNFAKLIMFVLLIGAIMCIGNNVYNSGNFVKVKNWEKLDSSTKNVCDVMLALEEKPRCVVPIVLTWEVRQYSGDIEMMYGRNSEGYINKLDPACDAVQEALDTGDDYDFVFSMSEFHGFQFVVTHKSKPVSMEILNIYDYKECYSDDKYVMYYSNHVSGEDKDTRYLVVEYDMTGSEDSVFTIENKDAFIIVEPSNGASEETMKAILRSHNNKVDEWYVTKEAYEDEKDYRRMYSNSIKLAKEYDVDFLRTVIRSEGNRYLNYVFVDAIDESGI